MTARPIYRIVDWALYEPPGVDSLKPLPDLLLPVNSLTIWRAYDKLRGLRNGAALFGVYVAMLRVAARCFPRGILINGSGAGMSVERLASLMELRYPTSALGAALSKFKQCGLIEEVSAADVADLADQLRPHAKPPRVPKTMILAERFLRDHPIARRLDTSELQFAMSIAKDHRLIRVYATGSQICISREAMYTPGVREPFIVRDTAAKTKRR